MNTNDIKKITESKTFRNVMIGIAIALSIFVIFSAGIEVGYRKAAFSYHLGENFYRTFDADDHSAPRFFPGEVSDAHGAAGTILSIDLPTFVVGDQNGTEKVIRIMNDTAIRQFRGTIAPEGLKVGDSVIIIGTPNSDAEIGAALIRIMPPKEIPPVN